MKTYKFVRNTVLIGIFVILITAGLVQSVSEATIQERYPDNNGVGHRDDENINITLVGSYQTSYRAVELDVQDDYAYVATHFYQQTCPPFAGALDIIDIATNPENPELTGSCDDFQELLNVVVHDDYAYVIVREGSVYYLKEVNIENPANPILYDFLSVDLGSIMNTEIVDLFVQNDILYVFTPSALMFYSLTNLGYLNSMPLTGLTCVDDFYVQGDYAYLIGNNQGYIRAKEYFQIINIADIWNPVLMVNRELGGPECVNHISINQIGDTLYAYFSAYTGLWIMDVTDPENPSAPITYPMSHKLTYIQSDGAYVYLSAGSFGIYVFDIADPVVPVFTGFYNTTGNATALVVVGNYIYVADDESGFQILQFINIEGPSTPKQPIGPTSGEPGIIYRFYVQVPPEAKNESIYLLWDWGDGTTSDWLGPYGPYPRDPPLVSTSHSWSQGGEFSIRVKAKNSQQIESGWSEPHIINIINDPPAAPSLPVGPTEGYRYVKYEFSTSTTDPNQDEIYYQWSYGDEMTDWSGPYKPQEIIVVTHIWQTVGNHEVKARAKDGHGAVGDWSDSLILQIQNHPPETPEEPIGPTSGEVQTVYTFSTKTSDLDMDQVYYRWDWGDGTTSDWLGPYDSEAVATADYSWIQPGTYSIRVKAKDSIGDESSSWSTPLSFQINSPELALSFTGGNGLNLEIRNIGDAAAADVQYTIHFEGGFIILPKNGAVEGVLYDSILPGDSASLHVFVLGFGRTTISATAEIPDITSATNSTNAFVFGPFVLIRKKSTGLSFFIIEPASSGEGSRMDRTTGISG